MLVTAKDNGAPVLLPHSRQRLLLSIFTEGPPRLILFKFPEAYTIHHEYCSGFPNKSELEGTTQLIKPQHGDVKKSGSFWIACLFTSEHFGRRKRNAVSLREGGNLRVHHKTNIVQTHIVNMTRRALDDLRNQLQTVPSDSNLTDFHGKLYTIRLNSKAFNTPWERTCEAIVSSGLKLKVMNNVEIMDLKERKLVLDSMEEREQDLAIVRKWREDTDDEASATRQASKKQTKKRAISVAGEAEHNVKDVEDIERHPEASLRKGKMKAQKIQDK